MNCFQLRRQAGRMSRHNEENPVIPNFIPVLTSEAGVTWERRLETEQLEVYTLSIMIIPSSCLF
jgi:hypothetical protein